MNNRQSEAMSYLKSLSTEQRDCLLASIPLVDNPKHYSELEILDLGDDHSDCNVMNYSQLFAALNKKVKLPAPETLRTGDSLQFGEYRGIATYYVIWLKNGIFKHESDLLQLFNDTLEEGEWTEPEQHNFDDEEDEDEQIAKRAKIEPKNKHENRSLKFISRDVENGPHNDGIHDCFLCIHPDEYGMAPCVFFASVQPDYFDHFEFDSLIFDPLLVHSQTYYGQIIATAKATGKNNETNESWLENDDFPLKYIGHYDEAASDEVEFMLRKELDEDSHYFRDLRRLLDAHFAPEDWAGEESDSDNEENQSGDDDNDNNDSIEEEQNDEGASVEDISGEEEEGSVNEEGEADNSDQE